MSSSAFKASPFLALVLLVLALLSPMLFSATASAQGRPFKIVALGDSLSAGYQLPPGAAFPSVLQRALKEKGIDAEIVNAGVSGDTATGGLDRLDWSVADGTQGVILELGANDALRGIDPDLTYKALNEAITRLKARGIKVLLAGMRAPPNMGPDYQKRFDAIYARLAKEHEVMLYPFFLDGIAGAAKLNLPDGIHPTAEGVRSIVQRMLPTVEAFLKTLPPQS